MPKSLNGIAARVDRLAVRCGTDEPEPDGSDERALLLWAARRYGLAALLTSEPPDDPDDYAQKGTQKASRRGRTP